jgi:hypothetical protein
MKKKITIYKSNLKTPQEETVNLKKNMNDNKIVHPFVSYQDMIDGAFYGNSFDWHQEETAEEEEDEEEEDEEDEEEKEGRDTDHPGITLRQMKEDTLSEISEDNTIDLIREVFNYCKKLRRSEKKLKQTVAEMKLAIADLQDRMDSIHG